MLLEMVGSQNDYHFPRAKTLVVASVVSVMLFAGCELSPEQATTYELITNSRNEAGVEPLAWDERAAGFAQTWAEEMAQTQWLRHSLLVAFLGDQAAVAENVGVAFGIILAPGAVPVILWPPPESLQGIHEAMMASPAHRAILLDPRYELVGTGVARDVDNGVWVAYEFADP